MKNLFLTFSLLGLITPAWAQQAPGASPVLDVQHYEISAEVVPDESFVKGEGHHVSPLAGTQLYSI